MKAVLISMCVLTRQKAEIIARNVPMAVAYRLPARRNHGVLWRI